MWCKSVHKLSYLTKLIAGRDVIMQYLSFSKEFIIHKDDIKSQIRGIMIKNGKSIAFYSCKLAPTQIHYKIEKM